MNVDEVYLGDCINVIKNIPDKSIDLIVTDPPYLIECTKAGGKSKLTDTIQRMNDELVNSKLTNSINSDILDELVRVMKNINIYIWCNHKQIPMYLDYFVKIHNCSFDIIIWNKTNAAPLFNNKYLTDKEYCLYFRKGAYCNPNNYHEAKTVYQQPMNVKDKRKWDHPTIKPLNIIETIIKNSSKENDIVLDPYAGSGTTGVACIRNNRRYILIEIEEKYYNTINKRLSEELINEKAA